MKTKSKAVTEKSKDIKLSSPEIKVIERLSKIDSNIPQKQFIEQCIDELKAYWDELNHT